MEGTEKVRIINPDLTHKNPFGETVVGLNRAVYDVWVKRLDKGGKEFQYSQTEALDFNTIFEVRSFGALDRMDESWYIEDGLGYKYDVQAVARHRRYMGRLNILLVYAKKRQPKP